ncbi:unnamed protein product [Brassica oleracea var. botrytis]
MFQQIQEKRFPVIPQGGSVIQLAEPSTAAEKVVLLSGRNSDVIGACSQICFAKLQWRKRCSVVSTWPQ